MEKVKCPTCTGCGFYGDSWWTFDCEDCHGTGYKLDKEKRIMTYRIRGVQSGDYLTLDIPGFRGNQLFALQMARERKEDVNVICEEDDAILCTATSDNHGDVYLALCTTGNLDDPTR
jgi:DnaJ-class molecular chaperone